MLVKTTIYSKIANQRGFILFQYLVPQHLLTWFFGKLADCRISFIKNYLISLFLKKYAVNMEDAVETNPYAYLDFQSFFIRILQKDKRPIASDQQAIISPVDGSLSQMGKIVHSTLIQAKGFEFSLLALLGNQTQMANIFENGTFLTFYLAPKDYHRVHFPFDAKLLCMTYIPGCLFSVNQQTTNAVPNLFARNERVVCFFETTKGHMAITLVGALIVGSIHTAWAGKVSGALRQIKTWDYRDANLTFQKGDELGYFTVGSTVIMLMTDHQEQRYDKLSEGQSVKMGEKLIEFFQPSL